MNEMVSSAVRVSALLLALAIFSVAQMSSQAPQVVLDNEFVRVVRVTASAVSTRAIDEKNDTVVVRLQDETARFVPKGSPFEGLSGTDSSAPELLIGIKRHWNAEMRPCAYPMKCTRETVVGNEPIAWTTTLFTNGFVTATTHKVGRGGTLTSSYYTAKGTDRIVFVPFTDIKASFGGIEEILKAGQPYFTAGTEVEVSATDAESRWFVLRLNTPAK
jgi:hypothetical protein